MKKMETESLAKIAIRGKGSVKEGKGRSDAAHTSNQEEDLHCLIMADTEEKVNKAKKLIHNVIETVSWYSKLLIFITNNYRLRPFRRDRTNSSVTSYENLLRLTALYVMMKIKHVRTVSSSFTSYQRHAEAFRWSNRSSEVRLPRATQLHCQHHLPCMW